MTLDAATADELIHKLIEDRNTYLESINKTTELLIQAIKASSNTSLSHLTHESARRPVDLIIPEAYSDEKISVLEDEDDNNSDNAELYFAQIPLQAERYDEEGLREHLRTYAWNDAGRKILNNVLTDDSLLEQEALFPTSLGVVHDRSHLSHYSIYDIGPDGTPLPIEFDSDSGPKSRSITIWNRLRSTNANACNEVDAVGRITIVRDPSPLLFAALHYTMYQHFDVDEMFSFMINHDPVLAHPHRAFSEDHRHQRSFIFNMEYFTIIGENCIPPPWQHADEHREKSKTHIPMSRCSAIIALSFEGPPSGRVRNMNRRLKKRNGNVFDPFLPWRVLSITCYPDWHSSIESHDSSKRYVNGPEAFLFTIRDEFRDASRRLMEVYKAITDLVEPPADFIFNIETRDKLLFEDTNFTHSRRYFWAAQTLGIMNRDIRDMIEAFHNAFKNSIWDGTDRIVWRGSAVGDETSPRWTNWRKRMALLRRELNSEIAHLESIERLNENRIRTIKGLHNNLFSGTSVHESRRSVEQAAITVEQGRNIKLLTLVTIFFLPLTFVTSVYGMTNMDPNESFDHFAWTCISICVPTYLIIGSLNTQRGLNWWSTQPRIVYAAIMHAAIAIVNLFGDTPAWAQNQYQRATTPPEARTSIRPRKQMPNLKEATNPHNIPLTSPAAAMINKSPTLPFHYSDRNGPFNGPEFDKIDKQLLNRRSPVISSHGQREFESSLPSASPKIEETSSSSANIYPTTIFNSSEGRTKPDSKSVDDPVQSPRQESLAGFLEFWQWQKPGRHMSKSLDPC